MATKEYSFYPGCSYERKASASNYMVSVETEIGENLRARLETVALSSHRALEARDYVRYNIRLDAKGNPQVIDVNPNPDFSRKAGFARAVAASGDTYDEVAARIVGLAWSRS